MYINLEFALPYIKRKKTKRTQNYVHLFISVFSIAKIIN
jgi:hypothetical protein